MNYVRRAERSICGRLQIGNELGLQFLSGLSVAILGL